MSVNNFGPFEAEIWGTVSDWAMVIVTSFTAIFIYRTLKSQTDVQAGQHKLIKIEQIRYRKQFEPEFLISPMFENTRNMRRASIYLKLSKNNAFNIEINHLANSLFSQTLNPINVHELKVSESITIFQNHVVTEDDMSGLYNIIIKFNDSNGEAYSQSITGTVASATISTPKHISEG